LRCGQAGNALLDFTDCDYTQEEIIALIFTKPGYNGWMGFVGSKY
jgi:hypothetical protein